MAVVRSEAGESKENYHASCPLHFNPLIPPHLDNPYPVYAQAREQTPVFFSPLHDAWVVTRYDDVRAIAVARLVCRAIPSIQVDWSLYGPKLAQVAIAYGADDLDAVPALDAVGLGPRRSPAEDVRRQIAAAFAEPAERNGRYELRT